MSEAKEMAIKGPEECRSVYWKGAGDKTGRLCMIDQRKLPQTYEIVEMSTVAEVEEAIRSMLVRGAPAIGAAGAFGMAIAAINSEAKDVDGLLNDLKKAKAQLDSSRPTAVNLSWATNRILELARMMAEAKLSVEHIRQHVFQEAQELAEDDVRINKRLSEFGAAVVPQGANILHHCNTGRLATVDYGTALGVIYECHRLGKNVHVWVDETRPRLQGARLTAWELMRSGVPMHLIADNAAGLLMLQGKVDVILFGADRVAANGDVANKIGTYKIAVCGRENGIPVYACVPTSTIDLNVPTGKEIVIEERSPTEVTEVGSERIAPEGCPVFNPAFDITPQKYLTGIITEEGICYPPFSISLREAKMKAERRQAELMKARTQQALSCASS